MKISKNDNEFYQTFRYLEFYVGEFIIILILKKISIILEILREYEKDEENEKKTIKQGYFQGQKEDRF